MHLFCNSQVPLLRWKRFAVVAAMCIFAVRAVIVQVAFYLHIQVMISFVAVVPFSTCYLIRIFDLVISLAA